MPTGPERSVVNLRRAYFECRYGQLHVRTAFPSTGGFDERTPLVCLHENPRSSRTFAALLPEIGTDRSVYACDVPGCGESDPPPAAPTIADYAGAIGDFLDALRLRETDVIGVGSGAAIAAELAIARPRGVRRLVLAGVPLAPGAGARPSPPQPWPAPPAADGSHLPGEWRRSIAARGAGESLAALAAGFAEELRNGPTAAWAERAAAAWAGAERLALLTQKTLLLRPRDPGAESAERAARLIRTAALEDLPDLGPGCLATAPGAIAASVRRFLDR
jgi:pimeloyl-ACP methyl ester carboxylesterase